MNCSKYLLTIISPCLICEMKNTQAPARQEPPSSKSLSSFAILPSITLKFGMSAESRIAVALTGTMIAACTNIQ